jgi:hypothetical protein
MIEPVKRWLTPGKYDVVGGAFRDYLLNVIGRANLAVFMIAKPGIFCIAPGTGKVAKVKPDKQAVYTGIIALTLDRTEVFVYWIYISKFIHY